MAVPVTGDEIAAILKASDPDRYFSTLVVPRQHRAGVQALHAFNADVAAIAARVREPAAGEVRLQWWQDALRGEGHGDVRANPVAAALLDAIARYRLPIAPLQRLLEARRFDLYQDPMPDLPTFEGYAGETNSVLYQLAAMILAGGAEVAAADAAGHLGVAHALTGHLRAFGYHASRGRIFLPWSVLAANGVREAEVFSGTVSEGLLAAMQQLRETAGDHLERAAQAINALPAEARPAFAQLAVLRLELAALERSNESPFSTGPGVADWRRIAALAWWTWRAGSVSTRR